MKKRRYLALLILLALFLVACSADHAEQMVQGYSSKYKIGMLLKSMTHQHWMDVRSGAIDAARDLGVEVIILYPSSESAIKEQKAIFLDMAEMGLDAILFAPCDSEDSRQYVELAQEKGISVLNIDTRSNDIQIPYIGADNRHIGALAAERLIALTGGEGAIAIISGVKEQASHQERIDGFLSVLAAEPNIQVDAITYADSDFRLAMQRMEEVMRAYPNTAGVFCTSAVMGLGAIEQKRASFLGGAPYVVAVDTQDDALSALQNGTLSGLVTQNGYEAGYTSIQVAIDLLDGKQIATDTYIESLLLTRGTVDTYLEQRGE